MTHGSVGLRLRHPVPQAAVQDAPGPLFPDALAIGIESAPLLEEEGDIGVPALFAERTEPLRVGPAGAWAALAAGDDPVDAGEVQVFKGTQQRFAREKAD